MNFFLWYEEDIFATKINYPLSLLPLKVFYVFGLQFLFAL